MVQVSLDKYAMTNGKEYLYKLDINDDGKLVAEIESGWKMRVKEFYIFVGISNIPWAVLHNRIIMDVEPGTKFMVIFEYNDVFPEN